MTIVLLKAGAVPNCVIPDVPGFSRPDDPDIVIPAGNSVLTLAAEFGYYEIVKILLEHGADPGRVRSDGQLPEAVAEKRGYLSVAALIHHYAAKPPTKFLSR